MDCSSATKKQCISKNIILLILNPYYSLQKCLPIDTLPVSQSQLLDPRTQSWRSIHSFLSGTWPWMLILALLVINNDPRLPDPDAAYPEMIPILALDFLATALPAPIPWLLKHLYQFIDTLPINTTSKTTSILLRPNITSGILTNTIEIPGTKIT